MSIAVGRSTFLSAMLALCGAVAWTPVEAQPNESEEPLSAEEREGAAQWAAAMQTMIRGPESIELRDQGRLQLPDGFGFVPLEGATTLMQLMGNGVDDRLIGLVFPLADESQYFVSLEYEESGYIKDDEAREWDAEALLQSLKDGTEAANEERESRGFDPLMVTRWVAPPAYDAAAHRLVWSAEAVTKNAPDPDPTINLNTYVLGREGYVSANLITTASTVDADRRDAAPLLQAMAFNTGKRYEDFNESTDKVAAYGLTALIGGLAAKKLGLLAVAAAFLVKFAKIIIIGVVAVGAAVRKFFSGGAAAR
jgi:uncharacterized membrane-anchored protein